MSVIVPAILPTSKEDLLQKLHQLQGITGHVQIDIVDGKYTPTTPSWPCNDEVPVPDQEEFAPHLGKMRFEVDLLVATPQQAVRAWIAAGAQRITVHAESTPELGSLVSSIRTTYGHDKEFAPDLFSFGLAIGVATDPSLIEPYLGECDYIQFMGIRSAGKQGSLFDVSVLPKIAAFHRAHPDIEIQVDGGISYERIPALLRSGASRLVIGSELWKSADLAMEYRRLEAAAQARVF